VNHFIRICKQKEKGTGKLLNKKRRGQANYDLTGANGIGRPYTSTKGNIIINNNTYDSMGRSLKFTKRIDTTDYVTQNEYDLSGKVTKLTYPNNTDTTLVTNEYYPGTNLLKQVVTNSIITALYTDYAPTGKIGQITYPNGIDTFYTYDAWSTKLFGIVTTNNPANTDPTKDLQNREYTYSRAGDILQIKDNAKVITYDYTYDMLHRLVGETLSGTGAPVATRVETITLDYSGTTGPVHGVKTITLNGVSRTCAYDLNGNMVTSPDFTNATNPLNRAITYDSDNMPTRIVHANGTTVDFTYDGTDKRSKKAVSGGKTVLYLGDHYEVENGVAIKYIFGGNLRLAMIKGSLTYYYHKDHLGSTAAVTDETGQTKEGTTYEPFGSTRAHEGTDTSAYKFTDQELDNETNLYNYDARLYDPVLGMFVTPDSIVPDSFDPQSLNRYSYCRNNPLIYVDPSGHTLKNIETNSNNGAKDDKWSVQTDKAWEKAGQAEIKAIFERKIEEYINKTRIPLYDLDGNLKDYRIPIANTWDPTTNKNILSLDPYIQGYVTTIINFSYDVLGIKARLTCGTRSLNQQFMEYLKGRTGIHGATGQTVTNAMPGWSAHNYGFAFDICINSKTNPYDMGKLAQVAEVAKIVGGFSWGASFQDFDHFELRSRWLEAARKANYFGSPRSGLEGILCL
jgi:RHS repeat-associated protein